MLDANRLGRVGTLLIRISIRGFAHEKAFPVVFQPVKLEDNHSLFLRCGVEFFNLDIHHPLLLMLRGLVDALLVDFGSVWVGVLVLLKPLIRGALLQLGAQFFFLLFMCLG